MPPRLCAGFTLIELSIVLVIIGLLVGGVMVGRDLVRASEVRATISQIEQYNSAVHTFRSKYGGIPGDLKYTETQGFGLYTITAPAYIGKSGYGDGNGIINNPNAPIRLYGEPFMFWRHLSDAKLVNGNYGAGLNTGAEAPGTTGLDAMNKFLPAAKLTGSTIAVGNPLDGKNYFLLSKIKSVAGVGAFGASENPLTASEAYGIDGKIDDGFPGSGTVFSIDATMGLNSVGTWTTVSAASGCVSAGAYALNPGTTQDCSLRFRFQ